MHDFTNNKILKPINFQTQDPKYALAQEAHVLKVEGSTFFNQVSQKNHGLFKTNAR